MDKELEKNLIKLGFSENEARVYLAALETGVASAQQIASKAELKRTTAYSVLEALIKKGFVVMTKKGQRNRYVAESPREIVNYFLHYEKQLEKSLPRMEAIYNKRQIKPKVMFFEGKEGIKRIYEDTIDEKPEVILEFNTAQIYQAFPGFPREYVEQRRINNIRARRIGPEGKKWKQEQKRDEQDLSETLLLPKDEFDIPVEINIYKDKVAFMSYGDEVGLIIESQSIAQAMRTIYELFWKKIK